MSFINRQEITLDAILTKRGRELLSKGSPDFRPVKFAIGDDEIDYRLWDPNHANGSDFYGEAIEAMPLLQAFSDGTIALQSKLISLPRNTLILPEISLPSTSYILLSNSSRPAIITPTTLNIPNANQTEGYTATLSNTDIATMVATGPASIGKSPEVVGKSISLVGNSFEVRAVPQTAANKTTTVTIVGNETGGQVIVTLTVRKLPNILSNNFGVALGQITLNPNAGSISLADQNTLPPGAEGAG